MDITETLDLEIYRQLFENNLDAIFIANSAGTIYDVNSAAEEMLGWNKEEIFRKGFDGILESAGQKAQLFRGERELTGKAFVELKLRKRDGALLPVEIRSRFLSSANGESKYFIAAKDILEKQINRILVKDASELNKRILKAAPIGIATYNYAGQCVTANDYYGEVIGAAKAQVLTQNFREIASWRTYGLYELAERALNDGIEIHREVHIITSFGKDVWLDITFTSFLSNNEPHLLVMLFNISERKKTEEMLRESEDRFRTSVETMNDPFAILEAERDENNKIIDFNIRYINKAGIELIKREKSEISAENIVEFFTLENSSEMFGKFCEVIESGKPFDKESVIFDDSRKEIKYAINISVVKLGDGFAVSCREITEQKIIEKELRELNKNKDKFLSIIAHDLKSPFHSFLGITESLAEDSYQLSSQEKKEFFQASSVHVRNVFHLLEDLLQWANSQSGVAVFNPVMFDINDAIEHTLSVLNAPAKDKDISLVYENNLNPKVYGDRSMIETVIRNLVSNAIKFTNPGGKINIELSLEEDNTKVSVTDNGIGIDKKNIERIFKIGEKFTTPGTNRERGSGIGLMLCKDFIEKNKGTFTVESEIGIGSRFSFTVPVAG